MLSFDIEQSVKPQFVYKFKNPDKAFCTMASLNSAAIADFQNYMGLFDYQKMRYVYFFLATIKHTILNLQCKEVVFDES
jgi:hypothetical protein